MNRHKQRVFREKQQLARRREPHTKEGTESDDDADIRTAACAKSANTHDAHGRSAGAVVAFLLQGRCGPTHRFSLDKHFKRPIEWKTEADTLAGDLRKAIRAGTFGQTAPMLDTLTVAQLLDTYKTRYVAVERPGAVQHVGYQVGLITKTPIQRPDGPAQPLGDWRVADVTVDTLDRFKETRGRTSVVAANRDSAFLRAAWNWAIRKKVVAETPFKVGTETVVKLSKEHARSRRLAAGEGEALLDPPAATCGPSSRRRWRPAAGAATCPPHGNKCRGWSLTTTRRSPGNRGRRCSSGTRRRRPSGTAGFRSARG